MKKPISLILTAFVGLTSSAQAQANWTDLWRLLGTGQSTVPGGDLVYQLKDGKGTSVNVAASIQTTGGYASAIELTAFKFGGRLNAAEVGLLASDVNRLAQQCFNSSPDRSASIRRFLLNNKAENRSIFYTAGTRGDEAGFGPLRVAVSKRNNTQADSMSVALSRSGRPGTASWVKTCGFSG